MANRFLSKECAFKDGINDNQDTPPDSSITNFQTIAPVSSSPKLYAEVIYVPVKITRSNRTSDNFAGPIWMVVEGKEGDVPVDVEKLR